MITESCTSDKNYKKLVAVKKIITRSRETRVSKRILIEYLRKNYWLIRANICPYCYERFERFYSLLNHMTKYESKLIEEDYRKLREKIYSKST